MTPTVLAQQLGVSPKRLRAWLREEFPRSAAEHGHRWHLSDDQVLAARAEFGA